MVLSCSALSCRVTIALSLKKEEYSLTDSRYYCSLFLKEWSGLSRVAIPAKKKVLFGLWGGPFLSYSNPYRERTIIQQNLVDGVPYS